MTITHYDDTVPAITEQHAQELTEFLLTHLERYGDAREHIRACIDDASRRSDQGGLILTMRDEETSLIGAAVLRRTGMSGYIPENILVYLAVHADHRGKGLGDSLIRMAKELVTGGIALHVEASNPARRLYERNGFTTPYLEMRWKNT